ncbi:MAG: flagellar biosynthetic protein FliO [Thermoguttaceae bacterium]
MPSLIIVLGSCLVAASAADVTDRPANPARDPWWSKPPNATSPASEPTVPEYGSAVAAGSGPKTAEIAPPGHAGPVAEFAPDPPGLRHSHTLPAVFQEDSPSPAEKTKAVESAQGAATRPLPPPPKHVTAAPAASPEMPGTLPATTTSAQAAHGEFVAPLGLGSHNDKNVPGKGSPLSAMVTVGGALAIVLGLFFVIVWAMRKTAPRGSLVLPKEVFEILGRAPLGARQQVQLLRCGNKLLLVSITPNGTETLTEVTDPLEVDRIAGICQQAHPKSATTAFRQVFHQLAPKSGEPSDLDNLEPGLTRRKRYRWEEKNA